MPSLYYNLKDLCQFKINGINEFQNCRPYDFCGMLVRATGTVHVTLIYCMSGRSII
jgi:hypothetical protein